GSPRRKCPLRRRPTSPRRTSDVADRRRPGSPVPFVQACYIVSFSLFILGIRRGTHPTTAKQGNLIAATGMVIAVATTLALKGIGNWGLIAIGLVAGSIVGVVAS